MAAKPPFYVCEANASLIFCRLYVLITIYGCRSIFVKQAVMNKAAGLLKDTGRFVLSVSKDQADTIDYGTRKLRVFPDDPHVIRSQIENSGSYLLQTIEIENAYIFVSEKRQKNFSSE